MSTSAKKIPLAKEPQEKDAGSLPSAWSPLRESVFRAPWLLPKIREQLSVNGLVAAGTIVFALATISLAYIHSFGVLAGALAGGGVGWIAVLSSLTVSAQTVTPSWVRARVMAVYLLVFMGGLAVGSAVWGFVATRISRSRLHCIGPNQ